MILLDTDILTLYFKAHSKVIARVRSATEPPAITVVSRIEVVQGRFDAVLKAADGERLLLAQQRLETAVSALSKFAVVLFDVAAAAEFDHLRLEKKLKKFGRADLLIASIALAQRAMLVTRNLKDFKQIPGLHVENWPD